MTAILPNGHVLWLQASQPLASVAAVTDLGQLADRTARSGAAAIRTQRDAIAQVSGSIVADVERVTEARLERARKRWRRLLASNRALERKAKKAVEAYRSRIERQMRIEREAARRLARRDLWDKLVLLSSLPLFAAYGERGRPLGANNLALTLSVLVWLVGDEIVDALFGSEEKSPYPLRDTDVWSYIAPLGNLLAGWWLLDGAQHEPFAAARVQIGPEPFDVEPNPNGPGLLYRYTVRVDLAAFIAPAHYPDFQTYTGVPAVATIASVRFSADGLAANAQPPTVTARVEEGKLTITVTTIADDLGLDPIPTIVDAIDVAWIVDARDPSKVTS